MENQVDDNAVGVETGHLEAMQVPTRASADRDGRSLDRGHNGLDERHLIRQEIALAEVGHMQENILHKPHIRQGWRPVLKVAG
ncbi:MAG TPA: hypothetical protein VMZ31_20090, partial [Phycisphaerae bacterium]|nr:hypothetical protein [Phycisphaerae bacterium]